MHTQRLHYPLTVNIAVILSSVRPLNPWAAAPMVPVTRMTLYVTAKRTCVHISGGSSNIQRWYYDISCQVVDNSSGKDDSINLSK